jgi:hypothetical protein
MSQPQPRQGSQSLNSGHRNSKVDLTIKGGTVPMSLGRRSPVPKMRRLLGPRWAVQTATSKIRLTHESISARTQIICRRFPVTGIVSGGGFSRVRGRRPLIR